MGQWVHTGFRIVFSLLKKTEMVSHKSTVYSTKKTKNKLICYIWSGKNKQTTTKKKKLKNKDFYMVNYLYRLEMN